MARDIALSEAPAQVRIGVFYQYGMVDFPTGGGQSVRTHGRAAVAFAMLGDSRETGREPMNASATTTMAELPEDAVSGDLARIYEEIRIYSGVPYVSSLQRHVATMPGCLEYAWGACRPAFLDGTIPKTAWKRAGMIDVAPFPPLSEAALRLFGVGNADVRAIRNICDNFVRVAPINLLFAGCVERLIDGAVPGGNDAPRDPWTPRDMLVDLPAMVGVDTAPPDIAAVLRQLRTEIGGRPFVPGLYRLLANWPGYLAHAATLIAPMLNDAGARRARSAIAETIIAAADDIIAGLPPVPDILTPPTLEQGRAIAAAIMTYRVTSPEMIVFGTLLRDALPGGTD